MEETFFDIDYQIANTTFGELFEKVQFSGIFPDSKTFPDCVPKRAIERILEDYSLKKSNSYFDLKTFVFENFDLPQIQTNDFKANTKNDLSTHIFNLWPYLTISKTEQQGTYLPLPKTFVVPGGRFQELYYWDSYFTCLGLIESKKIEEVENILDNFSYLIDTYGFVPNGNRSYFLSRSQPPVFALMVDLFAKECPNKSATKYLPSLLKEYDFWMHEFERLTLQNKAISRVVKLEDNIFNRYWDNLDVARPESYKEDIELANNAHLKNFEPFRTSNEIYRNIRAAAESGWDFSARWFADGKNMETIETTNLVPVDLNCLLYFLETKIASCFDPNIDQVNYEIFNQKAEKRKMAIAELFWLEDFFYDYNFKTQTHSKYKTLAACFPLFFKIANTSQADRVAEVIERDFLKVGGLVTTLNDSGQQWDWPNGWAPLQWIAYQGLINYGKVELAEKIRTNWLNMVEQIYSKEGKLTEKYDVVNSHQQGGGGEYPNQDGFGWTNGVTLKFLNIHKK
ncbi:MAG: alpha,alpha-trehalase TreF [Bacteroidota bacterium]